MWDDAWAYDLATASYGDDVVFWEELVAELQPRRVLDLGCGTGRLTFPMARTARATLQDAEVVGLDNSQPFIERARSRLVTDHAYLTGTATFVEGDMTAFSFPERFDLIVLGYNNLNYVIEPDQRLRCLHTIRRHLADNGRFAIDLAVPDLALLAEAQRAVFPVVRQELEWIDPEPGVSRFVSFFKTTSYDAATQTEETTHYWEIYQSDGRHTSMVKHLTWHHYFPSELRSLLESCGLAPVAEYGGYDRTPFSGTSPAYRWVMAAS